MKKTLLVVFTLNLLASSVAISKGIYLNESGNEVGEIDSIEYDCDKESECGLKVRLDDDQELSFFQLEKADLRDVAEFLNKIHSDSSSYELTITQNEDIVRVSTNYSSVKLCGYLGIECTLDQSWTHNYQTSDSQME
ncbi:MAG: hypothetical protein HOE90_22835 [Bacteriovoracaceae bacterium]|jgi:hypothetical protein|nr:hypothetical protein [Bacteriovoracaceae bacterium]